MREIQFDAKKDAANRGKHGISLELAEDFDWSEATVRPDTRRDYGEPRFIATAPIDGRLHVLIYTPRPGFVRVIGLRKANGREVKRHAKEKKAGAH